MRLKVRSDLAEEADKLLKNGVLVVSDGKRSHSLAHDLRPLRQNGELSISYDRRKQQSVFMLTTKKRNRKRRNHPSWKRTTFSF